MLFGGITMAFIKGFRGMRYTEKAGNIADLVCPPYDIISPAQREALIEKNPNNFVRLELPEGEDKYVKANELYRQWMADGILAQDEKDSIYVYEMSFVINDIPRAVKGIFCAVRLEEFEDRVILPHEFTLSKAKNDRFELLNAAKASFSQIYSMYSDEDQSIRARIESVSAGTPDIEFTDDESVTHRLWRVTDEAQIAAFTEAFAGRQLFIADGHHRYETALNYRKKVKAETPDFSESHPANFTCMFLVDMECDGLVVFPTHRMLANIGHFDEQETLEKINKYFSFERKSDITNIEQDLLDKSEDHAMALYTGKDHYYLLTFREIELVREMLADMSEAFCDLDVTILHTLILDKVFGITKSDLAKQTKITYTRSIDEAVSLVKAGKQECAFFLNATRVDQIKNVAKAGDKMPQKATYFYPKLITGMVFIKFD
jgi:uncharacterized protein (DUF1015 family)